MASLNDPARGRRFWPLAIFGLVALANPVASAAAEAPSPLVLMKKLSLEQLMDLEVTSVSKRPEKFSETASALQVITGDDLRRAGATSLPEALRLASNLEVAQIDSRQWAITARGFNNSTANKMLVLIDGRTIYTPLYAGVFWDAQDTMLEDVDRIEVISGPGATQWGSNAVNGVINITSKSAKDTQGGLLLGGGGSELRGFGGGRYGGELAPHVYYRIYGKYFDRDHSVLPSGHDATDAWDMGQGGFRVDWDAAAGNLLTLQGDAYQGRIAQSGTADIDTSGGNVLGRWSRTLSADSDFKLQVYFDRTHRRIPNSITQDLDTYDFDFQHHFRAAGRHDFVWGLGYRVVDDAIGNPPTLAFLPAHVTRDWFSAFAQDDFLLVPDRLHFTIGAKLEHNSYSGYEFEPNVRLAWTPPGGQTLWAAVSRAVRTPSRIDRDFYAPRDPPFTQLQGGPNFTSEKLLAYEVGYRVQPLAQLAVSLATFYHDYDDLRSVESVNPPAQFPFVLANGLRGHSYGAELTVDWRVTTAWRLHGGWTELRVNSEPKPGSLDRTSAVSQSLDPNHLLMVRSTVDLSAHWSFGTTVRYVSPITNQVVPGYTEMDLQLGWQPSSAWEFSLVGQNLLHAHHAEFGAATSRREIERSGYLKALWRF